MKLIKENDNNNITIPMEILKMSNLAENKKVELHTMENAVLVLKGTMTAMEVIKTIEALTTFTEGLMVQLAQICGKCDQCGYCEENEDSGIEVAEYLLEEAGIPKDAKLCAYTEEDSGVVKVEKVDYNYDLRDVPVGILDTLALAGVCIGALEECLMMEGVVYGQ